VTKCARPFFFSYLIFKIFIMSEANHSYINSISDLCVTKYIRSALWRVTNEMIPRGNEKKGISLRGNGSSRKCVVDISILTRKAFLRGNGSSYNMCGRYNTNEANPFTQDTHITGEAACFCLSANLNIFFLKSILSVP